MAETARPFSVEVAGVHSPGLELGPADATEAVVYVHGSPGEAADWADLLTKTGAFCRSVALTMPGYGGADKPDDFDYTTAGYARHLGGVLGHLGLTRVHLVGHDLGVAWGLAWAAAQPAKAASLTLIDLGALPGYRWHRFARTYRRPLLGELLLRLANRRSVVSAVNAGSRHRAPDEYVDRATRAYGDSGTRRAVLRYYRATDLATDTVTAARSLQQLNLPTLVIWGGGDPYVAASYGETQKDFFAGARVVVLPDSGHWPFIDDPSAVAAEVVPFLRTQVIGAS